MTTINNPEVVRGNEGWLFLGAGSNQFMSFLTGKNALSQETINGWHAILTARKRQFQNAGIQYIHVFAPEKVSVYPEYFPERVNSNLGHIAILAQHCPGLFVNVLNYFNQIKKNYRLYDKTDTHWNRVGAFACYQCICSALGYPQRTDLFAGPIEQVKVLQDLGIKLDPKLHESVEIVKRPIESSRVFANLLVRYKEKHKVENEVGLHVGSRAIFRNPMAPNKGKVIIFGDSFSEYRPGRLTEMFSETFEEVHFCWSTNIDFAYVQREQPLIVITEIAERFAIRVPDDHMTVDDFARHRLINFLQAKPKKVVQVKAKSTNLKLGRNR